MSTLDQGVVSPQIPHFLYIFLSPEEYKKAITGAARLMVRVNIEYNGPALDRRFCYSKKVFYDYHIAIFRPAGGSSRCGNTDVF